MAIGRWEKEAGINMLRSALLAVSPAYFSVKLPKCADLPGESVAFGERVFAYELYHQMRCLFPSEHGVVHGEYRKALSLIPHLKNESVVIPDIVVHESGSNDSNFIAIEIKASPKIDACDLMRDIKKLEFYTNPGALNFKIGVMLLINCDLVDFAKKSREVFAEIVSIVGRFPRIAIWNIAKPQRTLEEDPRSLDRLDPNCLRIFRADGLKELLDQIPAFGSDG